MLSGLLRQVPWLVGLLLLAVPVHAQHVRAYVSTDSITVGDRFFLTLVTEHSFLTEPTFPDSAAFGDLEIVRRVAQGQRYLGAEAPGQRVDSIVYEVVTFALDTAHVPALPVYFHTEEDTFARASAPLAVPVTSLVPPNAAGIRDLAPLVNFPRPLWPYVLLALAALLLVGLLVYYLRQRRRRPVPEEVAAPVTQAVSPYEAALRRLRDLEPMVEKANPEDAKPLYVELSDILRTYLEARLGVPALERTTRELMHELGQRPVNRLLPGDVARHIREILELSDLVKFAGIKPAARQTRHAFDETRTMLDLIEAKLRQQAAGPTATVAPALTEPATP